MAAVALVDSCVWIGLLREGRDPARELVGRARTLDLATCGMVRLEVLRGVARPAVFRAVEGFMDVMINVPTDNRLWEEATREARALGARGITLPAQDLIIAACARRIEAAVLTFDAHFLDIPGLSVMSSLDELY
ncbi:MAG: PIN domain-containing protein [Verrucomicrobiae bacterium]|nr:PIN domain-containing protein [Verrucomicrobiae bacterium]